MLATVQRVSKAEVVINDRKYSSIKDGILIFVCIEEKDVSETTKEMAHKIFNFKMLDGPNGITSASLKDLEEEILIISQFTLAAIQIREINQASIKQQSQMMLNCCMINLLVNLKSFLIKSLKVNLGPLWKFLWSIKDQLHLTLISK